MMLLLLLLFCAVPSTNGQGLPVPPVPPDCATFDPGQRATNECQDLACDTAVLREFYDATDGSNWNLRSRWPVDNRSESVCDWPHVKCGSNKRVLALKLGWAGLSGTIPSSLSRMIHLRTILFNSNLLSGTIPSTLGFLYRVTSFTAIDNKLTGSIPTQLATIALCKAAWIEGVWPPNINLNGNKLTGTLPTEFGTHQFLFAMTMRDNQISGTIPSEFGKMPSLTILSLFRNKLTGAIPTQLANAPQLSELRINNNGFTGTLPSELFQSPPLRVFLVANNKLSGTLPQNKLGSITELDLSNNTFTGALPTTYSLFKVMWSFDVSYNKLTEIPENAMPLCGELLSVSIQHNDITMSNRQFLQFGLMPKLRSIDVSYNNIGISWATFLGVLLIDLDAQNPSNVGLPHIATAFYNNGAILNDCRPRQPLSDLTATDTNMFGPLPLSFVILSQHLTSFDASSSPFLEGPLPDANAGVGGGAPLFFAASQTDFGGGLLTLNRIPLQYFSVGNSPRLTGAIPQSWEVFNSMTLMNISFTSMRASASTNAGLPSFLRTAPLATLPQNPLVKCPGVTGKEFRVVVEMDAAYNNYSGCVCDSLSYGYPSASQGQCHYPCPAGGDCSLPSAGLRSITGVWCDPDPYFAGDVVPACLPCPVGYCVACGGSGGNASGVGGASVDSACPLTEQCTRAGRAGPLCGQCLPGLVPAVGTNACVDPVKCRERAAWVIPLVMVGTLLVILSLVGKSYRAFKTLEAQTSGKADSTTTTTTTPLKAGIASFMDHLPILMNYYQTVGLVCGNLLRNSLAFGGGLLLSVFNLEFSNVMQTADASNDAMSALSGADPNTQVTAVGNATDDGALSSGICFAGMTSVGRVAFAGYVPSLMMLMWLAVFVPAFLVLKKRLNSSLLLIRASVVGGVVAVFNICYSSLMKTSFTLVRCVSIKNTTVLWVQGNVECFQPWQYTIMILGLAPLILLPILAILFLRRVYYRRRGIMGSGKDSTASTVLSTAPRVASDAINPLKPSQVVWRLYTEKYVGNRFWWGPGLLLQRLFLIAIFTLVVDTRSRSLFLLLASMILDFLFRMAKPHRLSSSNWLDRLCRTLLVFGAAVGMLNEWLTHYGLNQTSSDASLQGAIATTVLVPLVFAIISFAITFISVKKRGVASLNAKDEIDSGL